MLVYDNTARTRLIFQLAGSIYRRIWIPALAVFFYSVVLHVLFWEVLPDYRPTLDHPYAAQSLSVLISFSVCFRTNIAWNRFWEACREVHFMYSKWHDAFSQLQGFINSAQGQASTSEEEREKLEYVRNEVTHYFSLLSCVAVERLLRGDITRMQLRRKMGAAWRDQVVFREHLRFRDLTGCKELCIMRPIKFEDLVVLEGPSPLDSEEDGVPRQRRPRSKPRQSMHAPSALHLPGVGPSGTMGATASTGAAPATTSVWEQYSTLANRLQAPNKADDLWDSPLPIIGDLSKAELRMLRRAHNRMHLVLTWINELITDNAGLLRVAPPILSRVFQELSNGAAGYSQAEKLADIPFPFIFAQILAVAMMLMAFISPVAFTIISGKAYMTPAISTVTVLSFWSLNEMSKELENPFGTEANNDPIVDHHERFVESLGAIHGVRLPVDRRFKPRSAAAEGLQEKPPTPPSSRPSAATAPPTSTRSSEAEAITPLPGGFDDQAVLVTSFSMTPGTGPLPLKGLLPSPEPKLLQ